MAEEKIELEIVTPAKLLFSGVADMVVVPGGEGDFGVLTGHAPMLSTVRAGTIDIYEDDKITAQVFVEGGFAEVTDERCTVLVETAMMVADIDKAAAEKRLNDAKAAQSADSDHVDGLDSPEVTAAEAMVSAAD
ncbi:MAG: ATP synthase F1 subunit epsilon [Rhodospirillaceae bacterium]|nr:ATP synthase F1 subunit epsilon [Rhodospirillaceae bacterium]MBL6941348.1 ATP synthase F1 subunit epsilon [Rhodospirillales bacterium]